MDERKTTATVAEWEAAVENVKKVISQLEVDLEDDPDNEKLKQKISVARSNLVSDLKDLKKARLAS